VRKSATAARVASFAQDFLLVFLFTAVLIWPLFTVKYTDKWASIESTFISDARFLKEHWPHPLWQPLWYGGTRFDYIYPPALRYGTAALAKFYPMTEARAYHLYTAFFYCFGIAGVYLLARAGSGSRGSAWLAAAASALLSPSFLFLPLWRADSWQHHPVRLGVLIRYGEGPHISAFALLPIALAASLLALQARRPLAMAAAAISCALVVSNNFYGAVALAICFPLLLWSLWITAQDKGIWLRALAIPALAYGLTAFWLVPSYLRVTTYNLNLVSEPGNTWSIWLALAVAGVYLVLSAKWARGRAELSWTVFVVGLALFFSLDVLGNHYFNFRVAGEPSRLTPELDLALIFLAVEGLRRLWVQDTPALRAIALGAVLMSFATALPYIHHAWQIIVPYSKYQDRVEFTLTEWMADHLPDARALATGSVRFWYDAWRDLPQLGGGSDQGVLNQLVSMAYTSITNDDVRHGVNWMQAFGVDAVIVHDKNSREVYHDYVTPAAFAGFLPVLLDDHEGNVIYRVPRRFPDLARVVQTARIRSLRGMGLQWDPETIAAYVEAVERGPDSHAVLQWEGSNAMRIEADVGAGQSVLAQVSYDPQWRAKSGGAPLPIRKDPLGQMLIETPPGRQDIRLVFDTPLENRIGQIVSLFSALMVLGLAIFGWRTEARS
jgi:hypothetical protein